MLYNYNYKYYYNYEDPIAGTVEGPAEGTPEDTQDQGQILTPSTQAQAQDRPHDATRQSEGGILPASGYDKEVY